MDTVMAQSSVHVRGASAGQKNVVLGVVWLQLHMSSQTASLTW